jgi:hypothetical protein
MPEIIRLEAGKRSRSGLTANNPADGIRIGLVANRAQRLGGPALDDRLGIVERLQQRGTRAVVGDQPERENRHLPNLDVGIGQQRTERFDTFRQADTPDGQCRPAPYAPFGIAKQSNQIGRGRQCVHRLGLRRGRLQERRRRRSGVAEYPLILETEDPPQFLFLRDLRRSNRRQWNDDRGDRGRGCAGGGRKREAEWDEPPGVHRRR